VKKKAASVQMTFYAGVDFELTGVSQESTTGDVSRSSSPSLLAFHSESPAVPRQMSCFSPEIDESEVPINDGRDVFSPIVLDR
jgi:hypothetical protein